MAIPKLTRRAIRTIRENPDRLSATELAERFGVHTTTVYKTQARKIWVKRSGKGVPRLAQF